LFILIGKLNADDDDDDDEFTAALLAAIFAVQYV